MRRPEERPEDDSPADGVPDEPSPDEVDRALHRLWDGDGSVLDSMVSTDGLDIPIEQVARSLLHAPATGAAPDDAPLPVDVEGYTILHPLGRGGMGDVFLAEQHYPRRAVALKVARTGHGREAARDRLLEHEAEMLARLQHPGIATIYDVGTTDDGRRYIAMELVEGMRLDHWLSASNLSLPRKLELFRGICAAVHYAHQKGVIHRDLKPTNVLVDHGGDPKVLDFGLAQDRDGVLPLDPLVLTTGRLIGTLPYMSPEQVTGRFPDVDARSDTYSLGVMLYQAVTGRLPYPIHNDRPAEAVRAICELTPIPPRAIRRSVPHAVEKIALRALQKAPSDRYATAAQMERDLGLALAAPTSRAAGFSLVPNPESWSPPFLATVLLGFVTIGLGIGAGVTMMLTRAAAPEPTSGPIEELDATGQRLWTFFSALFTQLDPVAFDEEYTVEEILDGVAELLAADDDLAPRTRARIQVILAKTYRRFECPEKAAALIRQAWDVRRSEFGVADPRSLNLMAELGRLEKMTERFDEAEALMVEEIELRLRAGETPAAQRARRRLARLLETQDRDAEAAAVRAAIIDLGESDDEGDEVEGAIEPD